MLKKENLTKEVLDWEYNINKKSTRKIGKEYNTSFATVRKKMIEFGISRRKNNEHYHDILHQKFEKLYVEELLSESAKKRKVWLCKCDCGNYIKTSSDKLISRNTTSCGCMATEIGPNHRMWNGYGEISSQFWSSMRNGARVRNLECTITIEEGWELFLKQERRCALTNQFLRLPIGRIDLRDYIHNASLDRIDSGKGYVLENCQWVDKHVNKMKSAFSQEEFIRVCNLVAKKYPREHDARIL